jgi:hypothetical protein
MDTSIVEAAIKGNRAGITDLPQRASPSPAAARTWAASARNQTRRAQRARHAPARIFIDITGKYVCGKQERYAGKPPGRSLFAGTSRI